MRDPTPCQSVLRQRLTETAIRTLRTGGASRSAPPGGVAEVRRLGAGTPRSSNPEPQQHPCSDSLLNGRPHPGDHLTVNRLFGFQRGVMVASRSQLGLPA